MRFVLYKATWYIKNMSLLSNWADPGVFEWAYWNCYSSYVSKHHVLEVAIKTQKQAFVKELPVCHVVYLISTSEHLPV